MALIGDTPYGAGEAGRLPDLLADIEQHADFALHVGDLKGGGEPCSDTLLESRIAALSRLRIPLLYTPGDNEWTDCWRPAAGEHDPLERLEWLRQRVFASRQPLLSPAPPSRSAASETLGATLERQQDTIGGPPENLRWVASGVLFVTLNLPGSDNARRSPLPDEAHATRDAHNRRWLESCRVLAQSRSIRAMAIAVHANPGLGRGLDPEAAGADDGYATFRRDLARLHRDFDGELLLMHGDTHLFRVNRILPRLTRVECFGSPFNASWVRIEVDASLANPFAISARHLGKPSAVPGG